jgi:membrane protease subunit HflC
MSLFDTMRRNPLLWLGAGLVAAALLLSTLVVVPETQQVLVLRFGKPAQIINAYDKREEFGRTGAGLGYRIPFADRLIWIDKRVLDFDMPRQPVLSTDQFRLEVDAFARYRVVNPVRMYVTAGSERRVGEALKPILGSALRNELGKRPFAVLLSPERDVVMGNIRNALARVAAQYGAEIVDVRIKRADLPDGAPLESAFERMRTARQQQALSIQAEGQRQAQIIRGEADAAAAKIYAASFGKDPAFYDFYRAMRSYRATFGSDDTLPRGSATILLSPDNDYLRQFMGRKSDGR